ncbi:MAG: tRNA (adenosine(37)-N6)-dimethylallyltransferase MiaA [Gemmatimonadota bacterium]|nr:MAG: tRNA (adenosine(37)-N6)-dimethylallyltransferase MiaA [Gemmatimonadota bacterium]
MTSRATPDAIVITGATGTGKTELGVEVAECTGGEIISADSRQVFRYMDIGTAKPSAVLRHRVPHHGLDCLEPDESYSAGRFARDAWDSITQVNECGGTPIIVGGTGFFIRVLLAPLGPEPAFEPEQRMRIRSYLSGRAPEELKRWLRRLDPRRAEGLAGESGRQRLARSLEVVLLSGRPHSWWLAQPPETSVLRAMVFCLDLPRLELYERIDRRFDRMMAEGLLDEVRQLLTRFPATAPGLTSVGYAELISHLRGERTLEKAVEDAKRSTRRFARRQLTWFRHQLPEDTIWLAADRGRSELVDEIVRRWEERVTRPGLETSPPVASGG